MKVIKLIEKYSVWLFWSSFLFSLIVLFIPVSGTGGIKYLDKVVHFGLFFVLSGFGFRHFKNRFWFSSLMVIYIAMAEIIQEVFIPGRGLDFFDAVAGIAGLAVAFILVRK